MIRIEETKVTITFTGNDDEVEAAVQRLEDMALQSGVLAYSGNEIRAPHFATNKDGEWAWDFTGTPAALHVFLKLVEAYCK